MEKVPDKLRKEHVATTELFRDLFQADISAVRANRSGARVLSKYMSA